MGDKIKTPLEQLIEFKNSKEWIEFKNYYNDTSIFKQLGFFNEDTNTNFLKSILEDSISKVYNFSEEPIKFFLEMLSIKTQGTPKTIDFINVLKPYDISNFEISLRDSSLFGKYKPDMVITFTINDESYLIILEAKTFSNEHDDQCSKYYECIKDNEKYSHKIFVYLTIDGSSSSKDDVYINITYQDLIDYVYKPLLYVKSNKTPLSLSEYIKTFNEYYYYVNNNFVITPDGEELTASIWYKYQNLFNDIFTNQELLNFFSNFKEKEDRLIDILFMNLSSLKNKYSWSGVALDNILNYVKTTKTQLSVNNKPVFRNEFAYTVLKLLEGQDVNELDSIINDGLKHKYFYSEEEFEDIRPNSKWYSCECYSDYKKHNGPLVFNGVKYYYMCILDAKDAEVLYNRILNSKYKDIVVINIDYNLKLSVVERS